MTDDPKIATPSPAARAQTRELAAAVVESVRADERMPLPFDGDDVYSRIDVEALVMRLALELVTRDGEFVDAVRLLAKATHGGNITNADTKRIAELCRVAGVEP